MTHAKRTPAGTITMQDVAAALRTCFDQASMRGLSVGDYLAINKHNRRLKKRFRSPNR